MQDGDTEMDDPTDKHPLLFLHDKGSKLVAMELHEAAQEQDFMSNIAPIRLFSKVGFLQAPVVIILATGSPETDPAVEPLWSVLSMDHSATWLRGMRFCCIGNELIAKKLSELGGEAILPNADCLPLSEVLPYFDTIWTSLPDDDGVRPSAKLPRIRKASPKEPTPIPAAKVAKTEAQGEIVAPAPQAPAKDGTPKGFVSVRLKLSKASERLGARWEQRDEDGVVFCKSVKKDSVFEKAGLKPDMEIFSIDGEEVTGEVSMTRKLDKLRDRLGGEILFKLPQHMIEVEAGEGAKKPVVFLYGSQTGNAEAICHELHKETAEAGWPTRFGTMNEFETLEWDKNNGGGVVIVISTTGDGEVPDNGKKFVRFLKKKAEGKYPDLKFAILALGDQNYDRFCNAGKIVEKQLLNAGCTPFCETAEADDGTGLELVVEPWRASLKQKLLELSASASPAEPEPVVDKAKARAEAPQRKVLIMYGSETGTSEAIARNIAEVAQESEMNQVLIPGNKCEEVDWETFPVVLIVMSTTGDGEFCENARKFWRAITKKSRPGMLEGMKFSVLALGDQSYPKFCCAGKKVDERMSELGAARFYPSGFADDSVGLEVVVEPWKQKLWGALLSLWDGDQLAKSPSLRPLLSKSPALGPIDLTATSDRSSEVSGYDLKHNQLNPFYAKIKSAKVLADVPETPTYRLTFDVSECGFEWTPGDAVGVWPCNDEDTVEYLLKRLNTSPHEDFKRPTGATAEEIKSKPLIYDAIRFPLTNRQLLLRHVDLFMRRTDIARYLANQCDDDEDRKVLAGWSTSAKLFREQVTNKKLSFRDVLEMFKSCKPTLRGLVEHSNALQPRYYSVASAMVKDKTELDICFHVERHTIGGKKTFGVCTNWLHSLITSQSPSVVSIPVFLKTTPEFNVPDDISNPMIMIGPGTGVAPFIAFLQYRQRLMAEMEATGGVLASVPANGGCHTPLDPTGTNGGVIAQSKVVGETHLFFGCKSRKTDYLYEYE